MRALQYHSFGEPADVVRCDEVAEPEPGQGEVRLRVLLSPIHNHDLATIRGTYGVKPSLPAIGGTEVLGLVDGRRVAAFARGAWGEYAIARADSLLPIPDAVPDDVAAQLIAMPLSAIVLLDELHVAAGDWIVQNAANGTVGRTLMRIAQKAGVNVVNLVRRDSSAQELRSYGAQHVVVQDGNWADRVREIAGKAPVARVVDSVCDDKSIALNRLLGPGGEHVIFGALAASPLILDPGAIIFGQTTVRGFWMSAWMIHASEAARRAAIGKCLTLAAAGELPLAVAAVHPLSESSAALKEAEIPGRPGKVLFSMS
jgi:NADPH:quinone reductase-like Zn-dependent oxidoreductase